MKKRAAIYARVSSKKQKEGDTISSQVEALSLYASREGYFIPDNWVFLDEGISGSTLQRPGLDDLRDMIRTESVNSVLIYAPDRLSRKYSYQLILLEEFRRNGVEVCFLKDARVEKTPEGIMFNQFQGIIAEYERAQILDRSRRGRIYKARQGDPSVLPDVPYGYKKIRNGRNVVVEVIDSHAEVVRKIFRLYIHEKITLAGIAKVLTDEGFKSPSGLSSWDRATIRDILKNPAYTGTAYYGKTEKCEGYPDKIRHYPGGKITQPKYAKRRLPEENWIPISVPQVISESDFELVQEQIKINQDFSKRNTKEPSLLQGLVMCGTCGNPFYKRSRKYKGQSRGLYHCRSQSDKRLKTCSSRSVNQQELDELVYREVIKLLQNPIVLEEELSRRARESNNKEEIERQEIVYKKELSKLSEEHDRLLDAYQQGSIKLKELSERSQRIDSRRNILEKGIRAAQGLKMQREKEIDLKSYFSSILERMKKSADDLSIKERQKLIRLLVEKVVIFTNEIKIIHCISPDAIGQENCQLSGVSRTKPTVTES